MKRLFLLALFLATHILPAADSPRFVIRSPESRATLLELYTSEG